MPQKSAGTCAVTGGRWRFMLALILSVLLIGFPLYYGFVLSTQTMQEVIQTPQKLTPFLPFLGKLRQGLEPYPYGTAPPE